MTALVLSLQLRPTVDSGQTTTQPSQSCAPVAHRSLVHHLLLRHKCATRLAHISYCQPSQLPTTALPANQPLLLVLHCLRVMSLSPMRSSSLFPLAACLLLSLALLATPTNGQLTSWNQVQIVSLSSPNCTQSGSAVINCPLPVLLNIVTSGWGTLPTWALFVTITGTDGSELGPWNGNGAWATVASTDNGANVTLTATVYPQQYTPTLMAASTGATAPLLNMTLRQGFGGTLTPGAFLISFAYDAPPSLTSISGCTGSGTSTTGCDPASSILTFTGSGFRWFSNGGSDVDMWINGESATEVTGTFIQGVGGVPPSLNVMSDTMMTVNLGTAYIYLLLPVHYGGALVTIYFNERSTSFGVTTNTPTNQLQISFIPQPAPNITSVTIPPTWQGFGCRGTNGTGPFTNCIPGLSFINIQGNYIYDTTITIGNVNVTCIEQTSSLLRCQLPALASAGPWSLVVSDPNALVPQIYTDASLITFRSGASLASVQSCVNTGGTNWYGFWNGGLCNGGQVITITGTNFVVGDTSVTVTSTYNTTTGPPGNQTVSSTSVSACSIATVISSTSIQCTLTDLTLQQGYALNSVWFNMFGQQVYLQVTFSNGVTVTNSLPVTLYNYPNAPIVTSVQGCGGGPSTYAYNCAAGATIVINGQNLWNNQTSYQQSSNFVALPSSQQTQLGSWNNPVNWGCTVRGTPTPTQIRCRLPTFDSQVAPVGSDTLYPMNVWTDIPGAGFNAAFSNQFFISFNLGTSVSSWSAVTITSLSSSQCNQSGNAVINCVFPATVLVTTSGYGSLNVGGPGTGGGQGGPGGGVTLIATAADGTEISAIANRAPNDYGQNMYLTATFVPTIYRPTLVASSATATAPMLSVILRGNNFNASQTTSASLVSFAYDAGPTLNSISGCTGSGTSTTGCDPASAVITFAGSGFRWYSGGRGPQQQYNGVVQLWLGSASTNIAGPGTQGSPSLTVMGDNQMTLNMSLAYTYLLLPVHYGGGLVTIMLNEQFWTTNAYTNQLQISFIPQPAPIVTSVIAYNGNGGCQGINGTGPFTNCIPQVSAVDILGLYMYDVSVTVNGVSCLALTPITSSQVRCLLPYVGGAGPWDLIVSDPNAQTNSIYKESGLIQYSTAPSVSGMTTCTANGQLNSRGTWWGGLCNENTPITISGNNFVQGDSTATVMFTYVQNGPRRNWPAFIPASGNISVMCTGVSVTSTTSLSCTLPYLSSAVNASYVFYGSYVGLQVSFMSGSMTSNRLGLMAYSYPNAPTVTSVSGCAQSNSALSLSGCSSTSVLTVTGTNLWNATNAGPWGSFVNPVTDGFPSWSCTVTSSAATQLVCEMPVFDAYVSPVQEGITYNMTVTAFNTVTSWYVSGNAFAIDFTPLSGSSSSKLSTSKIVAIAVLVPIAAIVLAVLLFVCCIRRDGVKLSMPKLPSGSGKSASTGFGKHVDESGPSDHDVEMETSEVHNNDSIA